jgi:hypothetical protein
MLSIYIVCYYLINIFDEENGQKQLLTSLAPAFHYPNKQIYKCLTTNLLYPITKRKDWQL